MSRGTKFDYLTVKEAFKSRGCTLLSNEYKNRDTPLEYICRCRHSFKKPFKHFISTNGFCKNCGNDKSGKTKRYSYEEVKKVFSDANCELLSMEYIASNRCLSYICSCGEISNTIFSSFLQGHRCKKCGRDKAALKTRMP